MTFSFLANATLVFGSAGSSWWVTAGRFLGTTMVSAYLVQNAVIYLTTYLWTGPSKMAIGWARRLGVADRLSDDFLARNTSKALAIGCGLVWNFCWYKWFVFVR